MKKLLVITLMASATLSMNAQEASRNASQASNASFFNHLDLSVNGWAGKQRGVNAQMGMQWKF